VCSGKEGRRKRQAARPIAHCNQATAEEGEGYPEHPSDNTPGETRGEEEPNLLSAPAKLHYRPSVVVGGRPLSVRRAGLLLKRYRPVQLRLSEGKANMPARRPASSTAVKPNCR
jgi:hypothetical protein